MIQWVFSSGWIFYAYILALVALPLNTSSEFNNITILQLRGNYFFHILMFLPWVFFTTQRLNTFASDEVFGFLPRQKKQEKRPSSYLPINKLAYNTSTKNTSTNQRINSYKKLHLFFWFTRNSRYATI